ncbi:jhy protein homolog isoform X2 [Narcine bancroftii]|uniref:jhy protein homolog isoform X2 n=1 Tax=Narcine bancroftii TaxID=1343680 RepID=UPI003831E923
MMPLDNKNPAQRNIQFNPWACIQPKQVPEGLFPLGEGKSFHLDTEFDAENRDDEGQDFYDSLEETEVENEFDGYKSEHECGEKIRNLAKDQYASLRYNPKWRNTREGTEILLPTEVHQQENLDLNDPLMGLSQGLSDLLENNIAMPHEFECPDVLEYKGLTKKSQGVVSSPRENCNYNEKQPKRKRPPSRCEISDHHQEERVSFGSSASYDNTMNVLESQRKSRAGRRATPAPCDRHGRDECRSGDEMLKDHEHERLGFLELERQVGTSQGVKFSLREDDNNEGRRTQTKRPPSPYNEYIECSQEECGPLVSFETDGLQKDRKMATVAIAERQSQDDRGKNKCRHEGFADLNNHSQKACKQNYDCKSMHCDGCMNGVKSRKVPVIPCDKKLQTRERSRNDIVEHNKQTLGARKISSYQQLYNKMKTKNPQEVPTTKSFKTMTIAVSKENTRDVEENCSTEMKWNQRAQMLQNCKIKQLSTKNKELTYGVRGKPPRPPNKPSSKQQEQKIHHEAELEHVENMMAQQNKNTSELLILHRDTSVPLTPCSNNTSSSLSQVAPALIPNFQPTVNLNIHLNTSSDILPTLSGDNAQTTVRLVPSHHPTSQSSSDYKSYNVYNAVQPPNPVPYFQYHQRTTHNPHQYNSSPSKFSTTLRALENAQHQPMSNAQAPFQVLSAQTHHNLMVNPSYHQCALGPGFYSHPQTNPIPYSVNQEKMRDLNYFGKEYGNSGLPTFPFLTSYQQYLVQTPSTNLNQQMEHIYKATPRLAQTHPDSHLVLPFIDPMAGSSSELDTNKKIPTSLTRSNSDGYLAQMEKVNKLKEKKHFKHYAVRDHKDLKQDIKLGGLGTDYKSIQEKAEKMKLQKEYSKQIKEQNLKGGCKSASSLQKQSPSTDNKTIISSRKLAMEYAKSIHKPKPLSANSKVANKSLAQDKLTKQDHYVELGPSENTILEMMQQRHEKEKQIVAAFKAMHVT